MGWNASGGEPGSDLLKVECATRCEAYDNKEMRWRVGTCSKSTLPGGLEMCLCSVSGGDFTFSIIIKV